MDQGFLKYVKKALVAKWNLLMLASGVTLAVLSGKPDVVLPLVCAAELLFLASLSTHKRFQSAVDAEQHKLTQGEKAKLAEQKTSQVLAALSPADRAQFDTLKHQCIELKMLAQSIKGEPLVTDGAIDGVQSEGMNRLLWIYLRLLYSKTALERFFATIDTGKINKEMAAAKERIKELKPTEAESANDSRRRASLEDQISTYEARLSNYQLAKDNFEFIKDEIGRLSAKIASLAEMAINRQDPNFITSEVDTVSHSVESSEKAMSDIAFLTGWSEESEHTPDLLAPNLNTQNIS